MSLSLISWTFVATAALSFAACAKSIEDDSSILGGDGTDSGVSTQPVTGEDAGNNNVSTPTGEDAGTVSSEDAGGNVSPSEDSGSSPPPSDDAGGNTPPVVDSGSSSGGQDSAPPPSTAVCPDTSKYQDEYAVEDLLGEGTPCTANGDCSSKQCCYAGSVAADGPLCVTK